MRSRFTAFVLALGLAACHEDPEISTVFINVIPSGLTVATAGGAASESGAVGGDGG